MNDLSGFFNPKQSVEIYEVGELWHDAKIMRVWVRDVFQTVSEAQFRDGELLRIGPVILRCNERDLYANELLLPLSLRPVDAKLHHDQFRNDLCVEFAGFFKNADVGFTSFLWWVANSLYEMVTDKAEGRIVETSPAATLAFLEAKAEVAKPSAVLGMYREILALLVTVVFSVHNGKLWDGLFARLAGVDQVPLIPLKLIRLFLLCYGHPGLKTVEVTEEEISEIEARIGRDIPTGRVRRALGMTPSTVDSTQPPEQPARRQPESKYVQSKRKKRRSTSLPKIEYERRVA